MKPQFFGKGEDNPGGRTFLEHPSPALHAPRDNISFRTIRNPDIDIEKYCENILGISFAQVQGNHTPHPIPTPIQKLIHLLAS